ncbi:PD40 domain-containing protein [Piscinibacter gummiphilus]|uniref:Uncharacterized protein n=1 Tax=Piscinibacter gummiphilus TaxID=946333 RepID=A0A1W6LH52_9BURK|nr:PD40 domain-containing protein [Piscinibacter gummiphilus]ARN23546.1 hypothetical protein A4W93_28655 [Piscinibacter gummiphilus]ATU68255.1 hypothetical protein CPZ87_28790 [Piscinibacter gummiphilus]GLS97582.1 hypothetical protein GCM10007918_48740 [Piscinibacter gummiphilus]
MNKLQRMSAIAGLALAVCALVGCGGGGGGDPAVDTTPPPAGGGNAVNPGLTGSIYMTPVASLDLLRVDAATGASTPVVRAPSNKHLLYVSPDGSRYAQVVHDSVVGQENSEYMVLEVYDTATKNRLFKLEFDGFANNFGFSPDNRFLAAIRYPNRVGELNLAESGLAILDLADPANPTTVVNFSRTGKNVVFGYDWLPNNQFVYLRGDRSIVTGSALVAGGNETVKGTVDVPAGLFIGRTINASPDGTQLLVNFNWEDGVTQFDVWVTAADGSGSQRFSTGKYGGGASWSPDGKYIVLSTDAGFYSQGGASTAYCKRWYAPSTARNVYEGSPESRQVQYLESGKAAVMPCRAGATYLN